MSKAGSLDVPERSMVGCRCRCSPLDVSKRLKEKRERERFAEEEDDEAMAAFIWELRAFASVASSSFSACVPGDASSLSPSLTPSSFLSCTLRGAQRRRPG